MTSKVQIWLRLDQAECVLSALSYASGACKIVANESLNYPERRLAGKLARERLDEVSSIVNEAVAKVQS